MDMKKFMIPDGLEKYIGSILEMYEIPSQMEANVILLPNNVTEEEFNEIIEDTRCEQERIEEHSALPVITYKTMLNEEKLRMVMAYYGQDSEDIDSYVFHITKREEEKLDLPNEDIGDWHRRTLGPEAADLGEEIRDENGEYHYTGRFYTTMKLQPYLKAVMDRERIQYTEEYEECLWGIMTFFNTYISEEEHYELVIDAMCEMQRTNSGDGLPVYSQKTLENEEKLSRLMKINGTEEYNLLSCDHWAQMRAERSEEEIKTEERRDEEGGASVDYGWDCRKYGEEFDGGFTTSDEMFPYLKLVLGRENIDYKIENRIINGKERQFFITGISEEQHWEIVEDAVCEYQRERDHIRVPVYSYKTLTNPEKLRRLMEFNGTDKYEVLIKDRQKWKKYKENTLPQN